MNQYYLDRVIPLIEQYITDFEKNNTVGKRYETAKWTAVAQFQENWNIDSDDMLSMWKECIRGTSFLDSVHSYPSNGITMLLKIPEEVEFVRNRFAFLFSEDGGDLVDRNNRIERFNDQMNEKIEHYDHSGSVYKQTRATTITYLNLWAPEDNYRYKADPANEWAKYVGFDGLHGGRNFSLQKYYQMCDDLLEVVRTNQKLIELHKTRFDGDIPDYDKALHILTFDVLYCCWQKKDVRRQIVEEINIREQEEIKEKISSEINALKKQIEDYEAELVNVDFVEEIVTHKKYGDGVGRIEGDKVLVKFAEKETKFKYPASIIQGFLTPARTEITEGLIRNNEIQLAIQDLEKQIKELQKEL